MVGIPVPKPGSCYFQKTAAVTPVTPGLLARTVEGGQPALVVVVPHRALSRGRAHLLDFKHDSFAQPYRFFVMVLLAAAHVCKASQVMVSYAPRVDLDPRSDDGIYFVLYPKRRGGGGGAHRRDEGDDEDVDGVVSDEDLNAHTAQRLSPMDWIRRRLLTTPLAQLAELAQAGAPRPPPKAAAAGGEGVGDDNEAADAGGVAINGEDAVRPAGRQPGRPRRAAQPTLSPAEQVVWSVFAPLQVTGYAQTVARQYCCVTGGRNFATDADAVSEVMSVDTAVTVKRGICSASPRVTLDEEIRRHDPNFSGEFVPVHPAHSYLYRRGLTFPTVFASFRLPHVAPYVDVSDPNFQAWFRAAGIAAMHENPPRELTFDAALAQWTAESATAMAADPPPMLDWVRMMRKRYESGDESRASLDTIFVETMQSYLNPENKAIGSAARAVADWTERNLGGGAYAATRFVVTKAGDNMHTAFMRFDQAVMNHGIGLSGGHELWRMLELMGMERMAFQPVGGSTYTLVKGPPGNGKSRTMQKFMEGCPPGMIEQIGHTSALARTGKEEKYGAYGAVDELVPGDIGYKSGQPMDPYSVTTLALNGGPSDCSGGGNETKVNLQKMAVGGVVDTSTTHMSINDQNEREATVTRTIQTGVTVASTNCFLPPAPALADRYVCLLQMEHPARPSFEAALSASSMCSVPLFRLWKEINLRRVALFQLLHVAVAAGFVPDVLSTEVDKILRRAFTHMMAMGSVVVGPRAALRPVRYIKLLAMDAGTMLFGKFRNPSLSHALPDVLREIMALSSPTWASIISAVTQAGIGLGPDPEVEMIIKVLRRRYFKDELPDVITTGPVRSSLIGPLGGLSPCKAVLKLGSMIASEIPGLTNAHICYYLALMTVPSLSNPVDNKLRVAMMPRFGDGEPYIYLQGQYLANPRGPVCDAIVACVPQNEEPQVVYTSYVSPTGAFYQTRIPHNDNMVPDENGVMSNPVLEDRYSDLGDQLAAARAELGAATSRLERHIWHNARMRHNNAIASEGDRQRSREATAAKRRDDARYYGSRRLEAYGMLTNEAAIANRGDEFGDELGDDLREPDEQLDGADAYLAYATQKETIMAEIENLRDKMGAIHAARTTMAIAHPVALSHGLVQSAPSIRDPSPEDREYASRLGVVLPEARPRFEQITATDADMSAQQLKHCGFSPEEVLRHAGYAPNTRVMMLHLCHVDRAFHVLRTQSATALETSAKAAAEADAQVLPGMREHMEEAERRRLSAAVLGWTRAMVELTRSVRAWERARANLIGANGSFDMGWARHWTETHFLPAPPPVNGTVVIESVAAYVLHSIGRDMGALMQSAIGCANLMGYVGLSSQAVRAAMNEAIGVHRDPAQAAPAPVAGVRRPAPEPVAEPVPEPQGGMADDSSDGGSSESDSDSDRIDESEGEPSPKRARTQVSSQ